MSVAVNMFHTVPVAKAGAYLAEVHGDDIHIWPAGVGKGPIIAMTRKDWSRIAREVMLALARADRQGGDSGG